MHLDALAAAAVADDVRRVAAGARVQAVLALDRLSLGFELYAGRRLYLTLSANPSGEGVRLSEERVRRGAAVATPLALAARARLLDARLQDVSAPPHERILHLTFQGAEPSTLVAELMGRMSNLILVDRSGIIVACARQVTAEMTSAREVRPGHPYVPPPTPPKADPESVDTAELAAWLVDAGGSVEPAAPSGATRPTTAAASPAWRVLVARLQGMSPLAAREIVFRACGDAEAAIPAIAIAPFAARLAEHLAALRAEALGPADRRAPSIAMRDGAPVAWAPYRLTHLAAPEARGGPAEVELAASTIEAIERFTAAGTDADAYSTARRSIGAALAAAEDRLVRRRDALAREAEAAQPEARERLKRSGELLLAWQWQVPAGAELVTLPPEVAGMDEAERMRVALDPALTIVENAQAYFDRYKRAGRAIEAVRDRLAEVDGELATLEQWRADLELAEDRAEIDAVHDALVERGWAGAPPGGGAGKGRGRAQPRSQGRLTPRSAAPRGPLRLTSSDGLTLLVGRNSRQNEIATFTKAARTDLWLHVRHGPGAHVIVKLAGRPAPERTIEEAAALAAWYSRERDRPVVAVAVTEVRHVTRMRGGGPGMVHYRHERTLSVAPRSPEALGLEGAEGA